MVTGLKLFGPLNAKMNISYSLRLVYLNPKTNDLLCIYFLPKRLVYTQLVFNFMSAVNKVVGFYLLKVKFWQLKSFIVRLVRRAAPVAV